MSGVGAEAPPNEEFEDAQAADRNPIASDRVWRGTAIRRPPRGSCNTSAFTGILVGRCGALGGTDYRNGFFAAAGIAASINPMRSISVD